MRQIPPPWGSQASKNLSSKMFLLVFDKVGKVMVSGFIVVTLGKQCSQLSQCSTPLASKDIQGTSEAWWASISHQSLILGSSRVMCTEIHQSKGVYLFQIQIPHREG